MKTLGSELRRLRIARGDGLRQVARELGINAGYLSYIEQDKRHPGLGLLMSLRDRYDLPTVTILQLAGRCVTCSQRVREEA